MSDKPPLKPIACGEVIPAPPIIQARPRIVPPYFFFSLPPGAAHSLIFFMEEKERMGGANAPAIFMAEIPPARKGEYKPPSQAAPKEV